MVYFYLIYRNYDVALCINKLWT